MAYLMIESPGEAPIPGLLLFGATTKDPSLDQSTIGMFGSGTKHAVIVCLRRKIEVVICSGLDKLTFSTKPVQVGDYGHEEVLVARNEAAPQSMGATMAFGQHDWGDRVPLALREFVSNALDAAYGDPSKIRVNVVSNVRAGKGVTRVFVAWGESPLDRQRVDEFLQEWFLHFRVGYSPSRMGPIRKCAPNTAASFYRRGVLIRRSSRTEPSLWDYNLDVKLDEARNADEYSMEVAAAKALVADPKAFTMTVKALAQGQQLWEAQLSEWHLRYGGVEIKSAILDEFDPATVFVENAAQHDIVQKEGKRPYIIPHAWYVALESIQAPTFLNSIGEDKRQGRTILRMLPARIERCVDKWLDIIKACDMGPKSVELQGPRDLRPNIYVFREAPHKLEQVWGLCRWGGKDAGIYINELVADDMLDVTVLEELAHWCSSEKDYSRGFQNWLFHLIVRREKLNRGQSI